MLNFKSVLFFFGGGGEDYWSSLPLKHQQVKILSWRPQVVLYLIVGEAMPQLFRVLGFRVLGLSRFKV